MVIASPLGSILLEASEKGLKEVRFTKRKTKVGPSTKTPGYEILNLARKQLAEYFKGERQEFDLPLDLEGSDFQIKVWKQLGKIPFGQTRSYKQIASNIHKSKATRAVGNANGRNPICIIVPCHRVIAADGTIGGYSGGLELKRKLLAIENVKLA